VVVVAAMYGDAGTAKLLVLSQVILSMQLPFAVIPLVRFVSDRGLMGRLAIPLWLTVLAWTIAGLIVILNAKLLFDAFAGSLK
jgi:manganese transport protein